uniref:condensation domain-containing protein n=1 Tax=Klebsiella pneumoniae TaxID=573 RepID=UPI0025A2843B
AAFGVLLKEITGKDNFTVGTPVSGRNLAQLQTVCGPLLNVLPVKLQVNSELTAGEYLAAVAKEIADMLDHSSCSQEELLSALQLRGELGS